MPPKFPPPPEHKEVDCIKYKSRYPLTILREDPVLVRYWFLLDSQILPQIPRIWHDSLPMPVKFFLERMASASTRLVIWLPAYEPVFFFQRLRLP